MKRLLCCCLLWATPALANDVVGCDPTHVLVPNAVTRFDPAVDFVGPGPAPTTSEEAYTRIFAAPLSGFLIWVATVDSMTPEQTTRMNVLRGQIDSLLSIPRRYWICTDTNPVDGVLDSVTEMSQAQKDAMDAPDLAEAQRQQTFTDEIVTNDLCSSELSVLDAKIDTAIDGASNLTQLKTVLKAGLKKIVRCTRSRAR